MSYQWDASLESGYEKVDKQHKQLFAAVNNLIDASKSGKEDSAVLETLDFLTGYAIKHFSDEEKLMVDYDYPDYLNHRQIHEGFKGKVGEFVTKVRSEGPTEPIIHEVSSAIAAWLLNHIKGDDFRMAAYVKSADLKAEAK